jgi:hypothetical protein
VILILTAFVSVWAQAAPAEPASVKSEAAPELQTPSDPANQTKTKTSASDGQKTAGAKPKKQKRGQLIIAPIPISSPAVGSGLVLAVGYVFKLNQNDKSSPPSTVGPVGAFTNSGSRGDGHTSAKTNIKLPLRW